jgi:hypothetical protein
MVDDMTIAPADLDLRCTETLTRDTARCPDCTARAVTAPSRHRAAMRPMTSAARGRHPVWYPLLGLLRRAGPRSGATGVGCLGRQATAVVRRRLMVGLALVDLGLAVALAGLAALLFV